MKITLLKTLGDEKMAPQSKIIMNILENGAGVGVAQERDEVQKTLNARVEELKTRQPPERILGFYIPRLVADGYISVDKTPKVKAEKPAKESKAKAEKTTAAKPKDKANTGHAAA